MWDFIPKIYVCTVDTANVKKIKNKLVSTFKIPENKLHFNIMPRGNCKIKDRNSIKKLCNLYTKEDVVTKTLSCTENHLVVFKHAVENKYPFILVFEDDVELLETDLKEPLLLAKRFIKSNKDWDLLYLGHLPFYLGDEFKALGKYKILNCVSWFTHAYFISEKYMKKLVNFTPEQMLNMSSEKINNKFNLSKFLNSGGIDTFYVVDNNKCYTLYPQIATQTSVISYKNCAKFFEFFNYNFDVILTLLFLILIFTFKYKTKYVLISLIILLLAMRRELFRHLNN